MNSSASCVSTTRSVSSMRECWPATWLRQDQDVGRRQRQVRRGPHRPIVRRLLSAAAAQPPPTTMISRRPRPTAAAGPRKLRGLRRPRDHLKQAARRNGKRQLNASLWKSRSGRRRLPAPARRRLRQRPLHRMMPKLQHRRTSPRLHRPPRQRRRPSRKSRPGRKFRFELLLVCLETQRLPGLNGQAFCYAQVLCAEIRPCRPNRPRLLPLLPFLLTLLRPNLRPDRRRRRPKLRRLRAHGRHLLGAR